MTLLAIAVGGGVGACLRWAVVRLVPVPATGFPLAITGVNVVGSFLLGLVVGAAWTSFGPIEVDAATVGVLGGFTTFSTWVVDIERARAAREAVWLVAMPTALGLGAAFLGLLIGGHLG